MPNTQPTASLTTSIQEVISTRIKLCNEFVKKVNNVLDSPVKRQAVEDVMYVFFNMEQEIVHVDEKGEAVISVGEVTRVLEAIKKENQLDDDIKNARMMLELINLCAYIKNLRVDEVQK